MGDKVANLSIDNGLICRPLGPAIVLCPQFIINKNQIDEIFNSLHKKSLDQILFAEMKATIETLKKKKLPLRYIELNDVKEMELGALVMFLFIETIFCCYLIDVNPFDQPAVEEGKILTKKILENE